MKTTKNLNSFLNLFEKLNLNLEENLALLVLVFEWDLLFYLDLFLAGLVFFIWVRTGS